MPDEYQAILAKVADFDAAVRRRGNAELACKPGCDACCQAWLSVSEVEAAALVRGLAALSVEQRERVAERGRRELAREAAGESVARCAMLEPDGACAVYEARPLVCRTQGHALRYPTGLLPAEAIRARTRGGDVTHCPLNFTSVTPQPEDVLDAERVDQLLALVNRRACERRGGSPLARRSLSELAASAAVLACRTIDDE